MLLSDWVAKYGANFSKRLRGNLNKKPHQHRPSPARPFVLTGNNGTASPVQPEATSSECRPVQPHPKLLAPTLWHPTLHPRLLVINVGLDPCPVCRCIRYRHCLARLLFLRNSGPRLRGHARALRRRGAASVAPPLHSPRRTPSSPAPPCPIPTKMGGVGCRGVS